MKYTGIVSAAALLLAACGQGASKAPVEVADTPTADVTANVEVQAETPAPVAAAKPAESTAAPVGPQTEEDRKYSGKVYTFEQAMSMEVMGLKVGMTPEEVMSTLQERGFEPLRFVPSDKILHNLADTEFDCERGDQRKCVPGAMQNNNITWMRPGSSSYNYETVAVLFYLNADRKPCAYRVLYKQTNGVDLISPKALDAMTDRFGEPSYSKKSERADGSVDGQLRYYLQMQVPEGYTPAETDSRSYSEKITDPRPITGWTRIGCLKKQYGSKLESLPEGCEDVMNGDAKAQRLFDSLRDTHINTSVGEFLRVQVDPANLAVDLHIWSLPLALRLQRSEETLKQQIADWKAQSSKEYEGADDL